MNIPVYIFILQHLTPVCSDWNHFWTKTPLRNIATHDSPCCRPLKAHTHTHTYTVHCPAQLNSKLSTCLITHRTHLPPAISFPLTFFSVSIYPSTNMFLFHSVVCQPLCSTEASRRQQPGFHRRILAYCTHSPFSAHMSQAEIAQRCVSAWFSPISPKQAYAALKKNIKKKQIRTEKVFTFFQ